MIFNKLISLIVLSSVLVSCANKDVVSESFKRQNYLLPKTEGYIDSITRISTGFNISREALVFNDGRYLTKHNSSHNAFMFSKNGQNFLIDTGMAKDGKEQMQEFSFPLRKLLDYTPLLSVKEKLEKKNVRISKCFITHLHFDHASAIKDFKNDASFVIHADELKLALSDKADIGFIKSMYSMPDISWETLNFTERPYGPFKRYVDYFKDGSLIIVELPGHTEGSIGLILNFKSYRIFMLGDSVWTINEVITNNNKSTLASWIVDHDNDRTEETIELLHNIWMANGDIRFVPAHDLKASIFMDKL